MRTRSLVGAVLLAACLTAGCGSSDDTTAASPDRTAPAASPTAESPLEGTWTTDLRRDAVVAFVRRSGWGRRAARVLLDPDLAGPAQTGFRLDFVGDRFRMSQSATDEQWQSGSWRLEGGRIYLDDEAPVGELTFRLHLSGDTASFDDPADTSDPPAFLPGVPGWAPGAALWTVTPWTRSG